MRHSIVGMGLISLSLLSLTACSEPAVSPQITVENAQLKLPLPGQTTAAAYFDITNAGGPDTLLAASAPMSADVELHNHMHENGVMKMRRVDSVDIPANDTVSFKPGGLHIMMFNANTSQETQKTTLTLTFAISGEIEVEATVGKPKASTPHQH